MNLRYLEYLRLVVEKGGYAQAAQAAGVSQPAVSQGLRALEGEVGCALFERQGRRQVPTAKAQELAQAGKAVDVAMKQAVRSMRAPPAVKSGTRRLRVGLAPAAGLLYGAAIFKALKSCVPECTLQIVSGGALSMLEDLVARQLDLVIAPKPRRFHHPGLSQVEMYTSRPVIYARQGHPLSAVNSLADIAKAEWVVAGTAGTPGNVIEEAFRVRRWAPPRIAVQCTDYAMLVRLVASSDLLGVVSHPALVPDPEKMGIHRLGVSEGLPHYNVCMFWFQDASSERHHPLPAFVASMIAGR